MRSRIVLEISSKTTKEKIKINRPLLWFNNETKQMDHFMGGKIVFDNNNKIKIEDDYILKAVKTNNKEDILKWIKQVGKKFDVEIEDEDSKEIVISLEDSQKENIEYLLDRANIRYSDL